nr:uncharacterized protein LOC124491684 [Dermatophagoides farinae]
MLFPVRCWTCGKVIGHLWNEYNERLQIAKVSNDNLENGLEYVIKFYFFCALRAHSNVDDDEEEYLTQQISELITEKNHLTTILPTFRIASACSDEDILSSNENEEMANTNASSDECLNSTVINNDNKTGQTLNTMKTLKTLVKLSILINYQRRI